MIKLQFNVKDFLVNVQLTDKFIEEARSIYNLNADYIMITKDYEHTNLIYGKVIFVTQGFYFTGLDYESNIIETPTITFKDLLK